MSPRPPSSSDDDLPPEADEQEDSVDIGDEDTIEAEPAEAETSTELNLDEPEPVPLGTDYAFVVESDEPVVVQHTRLDSRQAENALLSTMAFPVPE